MTAESILTNASDEQLAEAVDANLSALFRAMAAVLPGGEIVEGEELSFYHTFPGNPMFKGIWGARLTDDEADSTIDDTLAWFKARNAPYVFWWTDSQTQPPDLTERLVSKGFVATLHGDACMAVNLRELAPPPPLSAELNIVEAADQKSMEDWRDAFCEASDLPLHVGQAWVDATLAVGAAECPWKLYVGYWNEHPVATNILFAGAGVAGLYSVSTVRHMRRKGIGTAITLKPLLDARAQGYHYGVLFATEMGYPVYRKIGFRDVGRKIGGCFWHNPSL